MKPIRHILDLIIPIVRGNNYIHCMATLIYEELQLPGFAPPLFRMRLCGLWRFVLLTLRMRARFATSYPPRTKRTITSRRITPPGHHASLIQSSTSY
jgi:hypothetical protein